MKFNNIEYKKVDYNSIKSDFIKYINLIKKTDSFEEIKTYIDSINEIRNLVETMKEYSSIKYSINTADSFYRENNKFWDENEPLFKGLNNILYETLISKGIKEELVKEYGRQFYSIMECNVNSFSDSIINLLQEENKLMSKYTELLASAKIKFDNKICNLSDMAQYIASLDRNIRIDAIKAHTEFFEKNEKEFDEIFDKLVKIRHQIALKLGFKNFVEVGYNRMLRTDYSQNDIKNLRNLVIREYVPIATKLYKEQSIRINIDKMTYYDEAVEFIDGNASLIGDGNYIISQAKKMYSELSAETDGFYKYLIENGLFDISARPNKAMGGYCTLLTMYKDPFIFGNFNGTVDDVDVLTHEIGHAFQMYMSRDINMPEIMFPTLDSCEIHSMSMEFFTYPWMDLFFGDDSEKYKKYHHDSALKFIPYGTLVDHFQHDIYENPEMSQEERKLLWRTLEKKYLPHRDYSDLDFLEKGTYWFRQGHIFKNPFYYIDYVLAQLCAIQFYELSKKDYLDAWDRYIKICRVGGKYSFSELVEIAGLVNPLEYSK